MKYNSNITHIRYIDRNISELKRAREVYGEVFDPCGIDVDKNGIDKFGINIYAAADGLYDEINNKSTTIG